MQINTLDIRRVAQTRTAGQPRHPLLPPPILAFTQRWLTLAEGRTPSWSSFDMTNVGDTLPYLTILKCRGEKSFDVEFVGSAITALAGEDLTGSKVSPVKPVLGDIDWYSRARPTVDLADIQVATGTINPPYTSPIDYVSADFPFTTESGSAVSHVVCVTVAKLN